MSEIFLIDTESVNFNAIQNCSMLNEDDMIILFLTQRSKLHFNKNKLDSLNTKAKLIKIYAETGTKNSLDFQLVSFLGFMLGEHKNEDNKYYIVSNDKGFLSSINLLSNCSKQYLELISSISYENTNFDFLLDALIYKFEQQKFLHRTAVKMALLATSVDCYEDALNTFNTAFNYNYGVIERCKPVLNLYFNKGLEDVI